MLWWSRPAYKSNAATMNTAGDDARMAPPPSSVAADDDSSLSASSEELAAAASSSSSVIGSSDDDAVGERRICWSSGMLTLGSGSSEACARSNYIGYI